MIQEESRVGRSLSALAGSGLGGGAACQPVLLAAGATSMVYTPLFDTLHIKCRWFTHQPLPKRPHLQQVASDYPQRNTITTTSI